jgi:hypothetical protein
MQQIPYEKGYELACCLSYLHDMNYTALLLKTKVGQDPMLCEISHVTGLVFEPVLRSAYPLLMEELLQVLEQPNKRKSKGVFGTMRTFVVGCGAGKSVLILDGGHCEMLLIDAEREQPFMLANWQALAQIEREIYSIDMLMQQGENGYAPRAYQEREYAHILQALNLPRPAPVYD